MSALVPAMTTCSPGFTPDKVCFEQVGETAADLRLVLSQRGHQFGHGDRAAHAKLHQHALFQLGQGQLRCDRDTIEQGGTDGLPGVHDPVDLRDDENRIGHGICGGLAAVQPPVADFRNSLNVFCR